MKSSLGSGPLCELTSLLFICCHHSILSPCPQPGAPQQSPAVLPAEGLPPPCHSTYDSYSHLSKAPVWSCYLLQSARTDLTLLLDENSSSVIERSQIQETIYCMISLHEIPRKGKTMETESRLMVACSRNGEEEIKSECAQRI